MRSILAVSTLALALAGCGSTQGDRALVGGALGGTAGAVIGGVASGTAGGAVAGGLIGAAVGAIIGAATAPKQRCYYSTYYGRTVCKQVY
jgi:osmotically inducible lipoprotein OsmB